MTQSQTNTTQEGSRQGLVRALWLVKKRSILTLLYVSVWFMPPGTPGRLSYFTHNEFWYFRISTKSMICKASWIKRSCVWMSAVTWGFWRGFIVCGPTGSDIKHTKEPFGVSMKTQLGKYFPHRSPVKRKILPWRGFKFKCQMWPMCSRRRTSVSHYPWTHLAIIAA